jgi:hypothetical protein
MTSTASIAAAPDPGSAIIGASVGLLGGTFRVPFVWALVAAVFHLVMSVVSVFLVGFIWIVRLFTGRRGLRGDEPKGPGTEAKPPVTA